jgi:hypothetical protein
MMALINYFTTGVPNMFPTVAASFGYECIDAQGEYFKDDPSQ